MVHERRWMARTVPDVQSNAGVDERRETMGAEEQNVHADFFSVPRERASLLLVPCPGARPSGVPVIMAPRPEFAK